MARCEDFPCCGHEVGCCPDYDKSGRQLNMVCTCGAKLPVTARYSICDACMNMSDPDDPYGRSDEMAYYDEDEDDEDTDEEDEDWDDDWEDDSWIDEEE